MEQQGQGPTPERREPGAAGWMISRGRTEPRTRMLRAVGAVAAAVTALALFGGWPWPVSPAGGDRAGPGTSSGSPIDAGDGGAVGAPTPPTVSDVEQIVEGVLFERSEPVRVPEVASGRFRTAPSSNEREATGGTGGEVTRYTVQVEDGLPFRPAAVGSFVDAVLADGRGWEADGRSLVRSAAAVEPDFRVVLAAPETADALCAPLDTGGRLSCRNGQDVVINAWRWANGAAGYTEIESYRTYVINHEVGHALGFPHVACPAQGAPSPVMVQQTIGLQGCAPNPWPGPVDLR